MNQLSKFIKERRKDLALSQIEMAEKIGITNVTLSKLENSNYCGSNTLRKLSAYFHISTRDLRGLMYFENEDN